MGNILQCRWFIDYIKSALVQRNWTLTENRPVRAKLKATIRIYEVGNKKLIRLGNHMSEASGYWFEPED